MRLKIGFPKQLKVNFYPLLVLAIPLVFTGLLQSSIFFFETIFLARLGPDSLAAGALVSWLFGTFLVILFGTLSSINILIAHKYGAKDFQGISFIVRDGVWLALLLSIPSIILFWNLAPVFLWLGQSPAVVKLAETYLHALTWGLLPNLVLFALLEFIVGLGHARVLLVFTILSVSLSVFFSFVLVFGMWGFPALGVAGAGWGTSISNSISLIFLILYILKKEEYKKYLHYLMKATKESYLIELIRIGTPMGFMYCVEVGFFFAITVVMGTLGSDALAANQVAMQYLGTLMAVVFSMAQAITVRMGHLLGAGDVKSAKKAGYIGTFMSGLFMMVVAVCYWTMPDALISIDFNPQDTKNFELVHIARQLLTIGALFQIFEAIRISLFGALRALKDTRFTLFTSIMSFWVLGFPAGYFMTMHLKFGGPGLWWGMTLGAVFSVCLLLWRFQFKIKNY